MSVGPDAMRDVRLASLDAQRDILLHKVTGLGDDDLRRRLVPSETTLLGLVKHLAYSISTVGSARSAAASWHRPD